MSRTTTPCLEATSTSTQFGIAAQNEARGIGTSRRDHAECAHASIASSISDCVLVEVASRHGVVVRLTFRPPYCPLLVDAAGDLKDLVGSVSLHRRRFLGRRIDGVARRSRLTASFHDQDNLDCRRYGNRLRAPPDSEPPECYWRPSCTCRSSCGTAIRSWRREPFVIRLCVVAPGASSRTLPSARRAVLGKMMTCLASSVPDPPACTDATPTYELDVDMAQIDGVPACSCKRLADRDVDHARRRCHVEGTAGKDWTFPEHRQAPGAGCAWARPMLGITCAASRKDGCKMQ